MFFGESAALTDYLPEQVSAIQQQYPRVKVQVAPCLVDLNNPGDNRIARILVDLVCSALHCLRSRIDRQNA